MMSIGTRGPRDLGFSRPSRLPVSCSCRTRWNISAIILLRLPPAVVTNPRAPSQQNTTPQRSQRSTRVYRRAPDSKIVFRMMECASAGTRRDATSLGRPCTCNASGPDNTVGDISICSGRRFFGGLCGYCRDGEVCLSQFRPVSVSGVALCVSESLGRMYLVAWRRRPRDVHGLHAVHGRAPAATNGVSSSDRERCVVRRLLRRLWRR